jgi:AAA15 family ATPase/GTPase
MLKSLKIKNFRCFEEFDLPQLGRVNLLVGKNNSGKTSILEAIHILNSPNSVNSFLDIIDYRGEYAWNEKDANREVFEINHLFCGHTIDDKSSFDILGVDNHDKNIKFSFCLTKDSFNPLDGDPKTRANKQIKVFQPDINQSLEMNYLLKWEGIKDSQFWFYLPLNTPMNRVRPIGMHELKSSQFVSLISSDMNTVMTQFNQIVLTPQEEILYESLRSIEPGIERIAPVVNQGYQGARNGGFFVSINKQRIPIGSMGYGIWRMLEITLAMVNIPGGTLLIDEIDTGLHFSVMIDLWKLICKTAEKLDIQVFATTHNSDCWKSLAEVANSDDIASDDITIHRIERGKKTSIVFNEEEMAIAVDRDIEVR